MCGYCSWKYSLNEDVSQVQYISFYETADDIYPHASLCFQDPFARDKLLRYQINESAYLRYLKGEHIIEEYSKINYNDVTIDFSEYVVLREFLWRNGSWTINQFGNVTYDISYSGNIMGSFVKCFAIKMPKDKSIIALDLKIQSRIFPNNRRPVNYGFRILFHYPNQFLTALQTITYSWDAQEGNNGEDYIMRFFVDEVQVQKHRNKPSNPCNEEWKSYDSSLLESHLMHVGCRTPFQRSHSGLPICNTESKMVEAQLEPGAAILTNYSPPCTALEMVRWRYQEAPLTGTAWGGKGHTWVGFRIINPRYKMIVQTRYSQHIVKGACFVTNVCVI